MKHILYWIYCISIVTIYSAAAHSGGGTYGGGSHGWGGMSARSGYSSYGSHK